MAKFKYKGETGKIFTHGKCYITDENNNFYDDNGQSMEMNNFILSKGFDLILGEAVNHPEHYQRHENDPYEAIKIIEAHDLDFHLGNAVKYILRAGKKDDIKQDLEKAIWYLQRKIDRL